MGPRYTRRSQYQPIRKRNHRPYDPLMSSGEDMGDGLNKYPQEFFPGNNARNKNYYNSYNKEDYQSSPEIYQDEADQFERSPYLSYDPYSDEQDEPKHMEYQTPDFPNDSFMRQRDEEDIDERQFFLPLQKPKQTAKPHFDNPLRQSRPSRPTRVTRQNIFGLPGLPGLSRPRQTPFQGGPIDGDFRVNN